MKLRGVLLESAPGVLRLSASRFFPGRSIFFSFHLTGGEVFYSHPRLPAG